MNDFLINEMPVFKKADGSEYYRVDLKEKPTGIIFGKMVPFTGPKGHGKLVSFAEEQFGHGNYLVVSPKRGKVDPKVDIFTQEQAEAIIKKANPGIKVVKVDPDSPYGILITLVKMGIKRPVWIIGQDREVEFKKFFKEFKKNSSIKEAKEVPDENKGEFVVIPRTSEETSATLVRKALLANDKKTFLQLTGYNARMWDYMRGLLINNNVVKESTSSLTFDRYYQDQKEELNEGGLAGHLSHPYEILSVEDFLDFYKRLLAGKLEATEKVDGTNLFVGFNKKKRVVFARNRSEEPSEDIESKFPTEHPGGDAFRAGFSAIKEMFEKLSKEERVKYVLTDESGNPKNFLNLEIVYGTIPNLIQYSDTDNFIVFHSYQGTPEEDYGSKPKNNSLLINLASRLGKTEVKSDVVSYIGTVRSVKKIVEQKTSVWRFKGPLFVPQARIKAELEDVAREFEKYEEVQKLKDWKSMSKEEQIEIMKSLTTKIGSRVLTNLASTLFSGSRITDEKHPKIEGLVTNFKGNLIKTTGDFSALNKEFWGPLKDGLDSSLKSLNKYVLNDLLDIPYVQVKKSDWESLGNSPKAYMLDRGSRKVYKNTDVVFDDVDTSELSDRIEAAFKTIEKLFGSISEKNIKKHDILKALRIAGYKLTDLNSKLDKVKTRHDLMKVYAKVMYGLDSAK